jgi:hypothetical protein
MSERYSYLSSQLASLYAQVAELRSQMTLVHDDAWAEKDEPGGGTAEEKPFDTVVHDGADEYPIVGTRKRYLWYNVVTHVAEWKDSTMSPFPPDTQIWDTYRQQFIITRLT